jgi:predicted neuraminidase
MRDFRFQEENSFMSAEAVVRSDFLYETAPFPSCHASTIVQTRRGGMLAAFFGGTHERHPDVCIWLSRRTNGKWSPPEQVADGVQADGPRQPTWNPVLFQPRGDRGGGPLMLFYKVGPSPQKWWGMLKTSDDDGHTWSEARRLPEHILGPIKNKPVQLDNGEIISPSSVEGDDIGWRIYFERSADDGKSWTATPLVAQQDGIKAIQPSILIHSQTRLQAIGRTQSSGMYETWSNDGGKTWGKLALTGLPNPNSGTDAVTLSDGRHLLVYNHSGTEKVRVPLNVATSRDGKFWEAAAVLEQEPPGQYSYPAVIQSSDGLVHVTYTWKRLRIKYVVLDPSKLKTAPIQAGQWP